MTKETQVRTRRLGGLAVSLAAALAIAACGSSNSSSSTASGGGSTGTSSSGGSSSAAVSPATLNGAGSTLAQPIYQQWGSNLKGQGLTINYNGVGSGAGIADLQTATVDFAGSDPALKPEDTKGMKGPALQFPVAFGAITVSYNLSGIKSGLKLDGPTLANIFSGKIKTWNDPAIKALNPGMSLPSTAITVVHRSDSSGTTNGFTSYLSDVSPSWKSSIGAGKDVKWPTGTGAAKNSGVAAAVKQTQGAVGYVEQAYAIENGFTYASVKNSSGKFIEPTIENTSAAANGITVPADLGISTINSPSADAYPIVSQTFLVVYKDPCKDGGASRSVASGLKKFLTYAFGDGQKTLGASSNQL
ncbi:MAG: phosphate ABC transporter substrate-binding protein PstS, partial [Solirubrobacteraceae bacterium]